MKLIFICESCATYVDKEDSYCFNCGNMFDGTKQVLNKRTGTYIEKEKTNVTAVNKAMKLFLDKKGINYTYNKARTTNSNYYEFDPLDDISVKIRVSDHSKAQGSFHSDQKEVDYGIYLFQGRKASITVDFYVDGVNYKIDDFKKDYDQIIKEAETLIDLDDKITKWAVRNTDKLVNDKGYIQDDVLKKEFNISNTNLGKAYLGAKVVNLSSIKEIKDYINKKQFKESPVGTYSTYTAKNGVWINTFNKRDTKEWKTTLPNNWNNYITTEKTQEEKLELKQNMRKEAINELDKKLKDIGK